VEDVKVEREADERLPPLSDAELATWQLSNTINNRGFCVDRVFAEAARTGTALEMNGSPHRLDLSVERARRALAAGCVLTIDSDAHKTAELDYVRWGTSQARRAWVEPGDVLNTRSREELLAWVAGKAARVAA